MLILPVLFPVVVVDIEGRFINKFPGIPLTDEYIAPATDDDVAEVLTWNPYWLNVVAVVTRIGKYVTNPDVICFAPVESFLHPGNPHFLSKLILPSTTLTASIPSNFSLSRLDIKPFVDTVATSVEALPFHVDFSVSVTNLFEASCVMIDGGWFTGCW